MLIRTCAINTEYKLGSRIGSAAARRTPFVLARPNLQSPVHHITKTKPHIVQEYVLKQPASWFCVLIKYGNVIFCVRLRNV